jgi:hypothetical protein
MKPMKQGAASLALALFLIGSARTASAVAIGIPDTFEDGTTQDWIVSLLGMPHPAPPVNVPTGGPGGVDDNFLQLTALGGGGAGSRLTVINLAQWAGDYLTLGVSTISMDVRNFGSTDLALRLFFEDPMGGPPTNTAITDEVIVPAGGDWAHVAFNVGLLDLVALTGSVDTLLGNVTAIRLFHSPGAAFPGPPVVALLGVDNIVASAAVTAPEPGATILLLAALVGMEARRRRRSQR